MSQHGDNTQNQPDVDALDFFGLATEDLNGECFIAGAEGEPEIYISNNVVHFPADFPSAQAGTELNAVAVTAKHANDFIKVNYRACRAAGRGEADAAKIAFIRFLAARNGLMSPDFSANANNCRYNHSERLSQQATADSLAAFNADAAARTAVTNALGADSRKMIRQRFTDMVCCVAYIFRVRGHHYRDDFRDRYNTLWARCLHKDADLPISWEMIATDALHAIMPVHLDNYWDACVKASRCAGALIKRFDAAPAGVAGIVALHRGANDVKMLFPGVFNAVPAAEESFNHLVTQVTASRWGGSVNARFYGAARIRVDESQIGALASVVMGIYSNLAPDSKLQESPALRRLAETAPATGGAIGLAAKRTVTHESMTLLGSITSAGQIAPAPGPV